MLFIFIYNPVIPSGLNKPRRGGIIIEVESTDEYKPQRGDM